MKNKLSQLRKKKGLTQECIAFEMGISQKAYSNIENGKVCLSPDKLSALSKVLEVSPAVLCTLNCECAKDNAKFSALMEYLASKNIDVPNFLK